LANFIFHYLSPKADGQIRPLWQSKIFWAANFFGPIGILAADVLATDMNGDLPLITYNASNIIRLAFCAAGVVLNSILAVSVRKYWIPALAVIFLYAALGTYFWYAFWIRHGLAIGFWIF
jgi:hypothetical protein